ncbi:SIMPL domain-containing protein [Rhodoferax koreense]|uniref:SIMPL domain-containing protein n=1 Tax=Rhodoferax koreensis TaxID=1842727 RepID=A0A1P8JVQ2_9BURK|nr:SIMPL domain-containing protein [Rhodoferax koreense]APW37827.1 SIMPL domain-containing protein [Rhodoferax koreense]
MKFPSQTALKLIAAGAVLAATTASFSQTLPVPQNVVQLSASGSVEVQQDLLTIALNTTRDGNDAAGVQGQLKQALDAALTEAKKTAQPGQMDVRTGNFSLYPRYGKDGKINGWQGTTSLILEGKDFARITTAAGKIQTLTLGQVGFDLSREQRAQVETEAQAMAIASFKTRADEIAKGFGFTGYTLREVSVNANDQGGMPRPRMMAMEAKMASDAAVPAEAGKATVQVTVSGAVQLK